MKREVVLFLPVSDHPATVEIVSGSAVVGRPEPGGDDVEVYFEGNIHATQMVELKTPGRVKGNIETPALAMDRGAIFEGTTRMENLGKAAAAPSPASMAEAMGKKA